MDKNDIKDLLDSWDFDPENNSRVVQGADGRLVMQVRLPLGIEQYEMDGRPDGKRVEGHATLLEAVLARLREQMEFHGEAAGFQVDHELFLRLQNEGILIYYRYLLLFQMNDYERVERDTRHNLELADLLETYAESPDDAVAVLQFKPYMLRMNAVARSMLLVQQGSIPEAIVCLKTAIQEIENLEVQPSAVFQFERSRSLSYLNSTLEQLNSQDDNPVADLEKELKEAVESENYERAAMLRDRIRNMQR